MNEALEFLMRHGAAVVFAAVFIEQLGLAPIIALAVIFIGFKFYQRQLQPRPLPIVTKSLFRI